MPVCGTRYHLLYSDICGKVNTVLKWRRCPAALGGFGFLHFPLVHVVWKVKWRRVCRLGVVRACLIRLRDSICYPYACVVENEINNTPQRGKKRKIDDKQQCSLIGEQILSSVRKNRVSTGGKKKLKKNEVRKIWMHAGGRLSRCVERRRKKILDWTTEILDWPCMRLWSITLSEIQTWEYVIKESFIAAP